MGIGFKRGQLWYVIRILQTPQSLILMIRAHVLQAATKKMVKENAKGKIVFVSSTLGYMSFVGWASYSPAKHALRGTYWCCLGTFGWFSSATLCRPCRYIGIRTAAVRYRRAHLLRNYHAHPWTRRGEKIQAGDHFKNRGRRFTSEPGERG
jgi:NAD(P)-dependent dehydrogenase (short-subunit alcohol dehydrogenase family)